MQGPKNIFEGEGDGLALDNSGNPCNSVAAGVGHVLYLGRVRPYPARSRDYRGADSRHSRTKAGLSF